MKEKLKANVIEAPTLFVGVGGTGCKIVTKVAEKCLESEKENISFVCMDTNVNDLNQVAKSNAGIYHIQTSNTQTVGNYLDYDKDALKNWFPKNAVLYDKTVSEGAGQVRAISRLALNSTIKTGRIQPLYKAIDDLFRKSGREMKQAMRCVMVSTASGGTGSGMILPLSMLIRDYVKNKYPNTSLIVRSLIMLPEALDSVIESNVEKESQRRNAYATIKEINAFMMKGSGFLDVSEELERYKGLHVDVSIPGSDELKSLSLLPFDFCFLLDGQNAEDSTLVSLNQYIDQAAQALYEQNIGPMQKKAFSVEDNIIKEMSNPGNLGRNRFGGIGAGVVSYPYEEIADYIAYNWIIASIGGEGESAKWIRYDKEFEVKKQEAEKKDLPDEDRPKIEEVYVNSVNMSEDNFSKNLRSKYHLVDAEEKVDTYMAELSGTVLSDIMSDSTIQNNKGKLNKLEKRPEFDKSTDPGKDAADFLKNLRSFESSVKAKAERIAKTSAEGKIFHETKTNSDNIKEYMLESLLKSNMDEVMHPNAIRYMLYLLEVKVREAKDKAEDDVKSATKNLKLYDKNADNPEQFDATKTKKIPEGSIDKLVEAVKTKGSNEDYERLATHFVNYYRMVNDLAKAYAESESYKQCAIYVKDLNKELKAFYDTFAENVKKLLLKKDEIVEKLKFRKGDSILHVCSTEDMLEELSKSTNSGIEAGSMLNSEINGKIFDAIRNNVIFDREVRNADIIEDDRSVDVFNDVLIGSFQNMVRNNCPSIDVNIIDAIALEKRLEYRIKLREENEEKEKNSNAPKGEKKALVDRIPPEALERHIREVIAMGERISSPGIQRITNEEPREVKLCAYNKSLLDIRTFRVGDFLPKGDPVDSVSRYELHFFNALYNLTPNKLKKFAAPFTTETGKKEAGLYHNAYATYARYIGPDSTKNMMISTHIDKRWDAISVMPEMDLNYMRERMLKIHQAMVYGLVHKAIKYKELSLVSSGTKVYQYESSEERNVEMIVPNGTPCDQFFEILDALYINSAIVEDVSTIKENKRINDRTQNSDYNETVFHKNLEEFVISDGNVGHEGTASLFEIPLAYYNSLPNRQRFMSEISGMIDAVIETFREELYLWERGMDAKFLLRDELVAQFELLISNYKTYPVLQNNFKLWDNPVIEMIFRKIRNVIAESPEPDDCDETIMKMRALISRPEKE